MADHYEPISTTRWEMLAEAGECRVYMTNYAGSNLFFTVDTRRGTIYDLEAIPSSYVSKLTFRRSPGDNAFSHVIRSNPIKNANAVWVHDGIPRDAVNEFKRLLLDVTAHR